MEWEDGGVSDGGGSTHTDEGRADEGREEGHSSDSDAAGQCSGDERGGGQQGRKRRLGSAEGLEEGQEEGRRRRRRQLEAARAAMPFSISIATSIDVDHESGATSATRAEDSGNKILVDTIRELSRQLRTTFLPMLKVGS